MRLPVRLAVAIAAVSFVGAAGAAGPYDGTYVGTSLKMSGTSSSSRGANACNTNATAPAPLTITNSHAQTKWGNGTLEGDVAPGGKLVMHSELSGRFEGQIDASGAVRGYFQGYCIFDLAWQRRG
ncbi:MAG TPA: hypothetical protein VM782_22120 [Stellaceae bacterium]|nr:hypothetical protein [Stellaceae bacterium]